MELVLGCDVERGLALWVHLGDKNRSGPTVTTEGQLRMELVPGAVDLVIGPASEIGLTASLHLRDSQGSMEKVLIAWNTPDQVESKSVMRRR